MPQVLTVDSETECHAGHDQLLIGIQVVPLIQSRPAPDALAEVNHLEADPQIDVLGGTEGCLGSQVKSYWSFIVSC